MKCLFFSALFLFSLLISAEATIPCNTVNAKAAPCVTFAIGKAPTVPPACCSGLLQLARSVRSVNDKKDICRCMKAGTKSIRGLQDKFLKQIPTACHINVGFPVSANVNCEK
ncbi:hypothetical protein ACJRO7_020766 [Eucalyptus globulus]|uniref:Non-specific lipid-transfer protein n=1 Tax=Eucalyptus globulus TaxID=34317 RepID=A0ABD3KHK7_EUCGL